MFALFYRAFGGDRRRRSPRRTARFRKSVEGGRRFFSSLPAICAYPSPASSLSRATSTEHRELVAAGGWWYSSFLLRLCATTIHHGYPSSLLSSLPPPTLVRFSSFFFFPPLFFHFFFFSFFPPPPFFSLLFLSFFQNERLRACTGTERPARWASALIGDATRTVEQSQGEEVGAEFFRKVFPIVDFRTSSLSLSLCVCMCVSWGPRVHVTTERGGETERVHGRRSMERRGTLIGTSDGTVMPIN